MPATISSYALSTPGRVEQYLGETSLTGKNRDLIIFLLNSVSMWAQRYTDLPLKQRAFEWTGIDGGLQRLDGTGSIRLQLPVYPIIRLTHINTDHGSHGDSSSDELDFDWTNNTDNGEWDYGKDNDYIYDPATGVITLNLGHAFREYPQNVVIKCQAGFSTDTSRKSNYQGPHFLNTDPDYGWDGAGQVIEQSVVRQTAEMYHRKTRQKDGIASYSGDGGNWTFLDDELLKDVRMVWNLHRKPRILL